MSNLPSQLDQLKEFTVVVADTGDFETMRAYQPRDATTNPSLILQAAKKPAYSHLVEQAVAAANQHAGPPSARLGQAMDQVLVRFGLEILRIIPGRVSTEVDARLSFDTEATVAKARQLIALYQASGIGRERVLIKVASTWEGIQAAARLEREGIHCNLTLLFSLIQAVACAQAGVTLISPFVGRILDWHKKNAGHDFAPAADPGVASVRAIYAYYKHHGHLTEVMGASFRNKGEILELAGCDLLTISPQLLAELEQATDPVPRRLSPAATGNPPPAITADENTFRWLLNEDAMATERTAEGIRRFAADVVELESLVAAKLPV